MRNRLDFIIRYCMFLIRATVPQSFNAQPAHYTHQRQIVNKTDIRREIYTKTIALVKGTCTQRLWKVKSAALVFVFIILCN